MNEWALNHLCPRTAKLGTDGMNLHIIRNKSPSYLGIAHYPSVTHNPLNIKYICE